MNDNISQTTKGDVQGVAGLNTGTVNITYISDKSDAEIHSRTLKQGSPYLGLRKFYEGDSSKFFGRNDWIDKLTAYLENHNILLLLGASGSGKSSLIRAGVIPKLKDNWGSNQLINLTFEPDRNPFKSFSVALINNQYKQERAALAEVVEEDTLSEVVKALKGNKPWLIFIDQFEELFTLTPKTQRDIFLTSLMQLMEGSHASVKVILTMRADFLGEFGSYPDLGAIHDQYGQILTDMEDGNLRLAIAEPAARNGVTFETGLIDRIIDDFSHRNQQRSGSLPLLQYTLDLLWQESKISADNRILQLKTYEELEGVAGALQKQANDFLNGELKTKAEKEAAEKIFIALVDLVGKEPVSKRVEKSSFKNDEVTSKTLAKLIDSRLLVSGKDQQTVEVAHEELLRSWGFIQDLIAKKEEIIILNHRLTSDAAGWNELRKEDEEQAKDELWTGFKLQRVLELREKKELDSWDDLREEFIQASVESRERKEKEKKEKIQQEKEQRQRELEAAKKLAQEAEARQKAEEKARLEAEKREKQQQEQKQRELEAAKKLAQEAEARQKAEEKARLEAEEREKQQQEDNKKLRLGAIFLAVALVGAAIASVIAWNQSKQAQLSQADSLARYSLSLLNEGKDLDALREAIRAGKILQQHKARDPEVMAALIGNIYEGRERNRLEGHDDEVWSVSFSPDGKTLASGSLNGTIKLWDVEKGAEICSLPGHDSSVNSVSFSPDGQTLASGSSEGTIKLWDVEKGVEIRTLPGHDSSVWSISFSPDGQTLASGSSEGTIKLWDVETRAEIHSLPGHDDLVRSLSFSRDGQILASGSSEGTIKLWNVQTRKELRSLPGPDEEVMSVSFSPDGNTLAFSSRDRTIKLWDIQTGKEIRSLSGHDKQVMSVSFSPDGNTLANCSRDRTIKLWDIQTGKEIRTLRGHDANVYSISFSSDGQTLANCSRDNNIKLWDVQTVAEIPSLSGYYANIYSVSFSRDLKTFASGSFDGTIKLWDVQTGEEIRTFPGHDKWVYSVSFSPDGKTLASGSSDRTIKLWDVQTGKELRPLPGHGEEVWSVSFSPDSKTLANCSADNTIKLWDVETGAEIRTLPGHDDWVNSVSFSPDGKTLASGGRNNTIKLWDVQTGKEIDSLEGHNRSVISVSFSPDGKTLASGSWDTTIKLWDVETGVEIRTLLGHADEVNSVSFSPDGRTLASGSADNTIKLWNLDFDYLMELGCDRIRNYLLHNPNVKEEDRGLCDGIGTQN